MDIIFRNYGCSPTPGQCNLVNTTKLQKLTYRPLMPARRQDRVTRGAEIKFAGAREVYVREFKSVDQTKKAKT